MVENNKKSKGRKFRGELEGDSVFTNSMDSPECLQILLFANR